MYAFFYALRLICVCLFVIVVVQSCLPLHPACLQKTDRLSVSLCQFVIREVKFGKVYYDDGE